MQTFEARVNVNGQTIQVVIQARNMIDAQRLLEAQYGKNSVQGINPKR